LWEKKSLCGTHIGNTLQIRNFQKVMRSLFSILFTIFSVLAVATSTQAASQWSVGQTITAGSYITATDNNSFLILQGDGNLCQYAGSSPSNNLGYMWCSQNSPGGSFIYTASLNMYGLFCVNKNGSSWWCCSTDQGTQSSSYKVGIDTSDTTKRWGIILNGVYAYCRAV
jgi:hypothetical protein